ncbi:uncharacterized protein LOC119768727 isoform X3 [Culex quinquefasciatus]|nr:uncharacterized protein LOC119768727 isoform X3 [Culex quinquefasciatus]
MSELRTDETFKNLSDGHHLTNNLPPLAQIGIGCVTTVPTDYMHNVLLGVFKTLLRYWTDTPGHRYAMTDTQKIDVNRRLAMTKNQICNDFVRKPRPLADLKWYKATELRLLLLYLGPFVFYENMNSACYNNFIKLHTAIRILCHPVLYKTRNLFAEQLLYAFAHEFISLYGREFFVYNFHLITHLAKDCTIHGPLDAFSAFCFENYLQLMINYIKKAPMPLHQFKNRLGEHTFFGNRDKKNQTRQRDGVYRTITTDNDCVLSIEPNDSYVSKDAELFKIVKIHKNGSNFVLECFKIVELFSIYTDPWDSKSNGLYCSERESLTAETVLVAANEVKKVMRIKLVGLIGFIEVLHTDH